MCSNFFAQNLFGTQEIENEVLHFLSFEVIELQLQTLQLQDLELLSIKYSIIYFYSLIK
jgi:hypothetical protein